MLFWIKGLEAHCLRENKKGLKMYPISSSNVILLRKKYQEKWYQLLEIAQKRQKAFSEK